MGLQMIVYKLALSFSVEKEDRPLIMVLNPAPEFNRSLVTWKTIRRVLSLVQIKHDKPGC